ncbi:Nucleoside-diphosphate-sugar epimerase [Lachnospiraceae bacterium YSD2013]|nr:Nucleoside-diphosphate-sugar epimerase [Lachnospiraceae bacterium YSD2013]
MSYAESIKTAARQYDFSNKRILVTGASGLVGSCIIDILKECNALNNSKIEIYALGRNKNRLKARFGSDVICIEQDIRMPLDTSVEYDYIIHAASNADPVRYAIEPVETILTNVEGCKNVFEYARIHKSTRILLTSTFEVYGKIEGVDTYTEDMYGAVDFHLLRNGYTESKRCSEMLACSYCDEYGVDVVIARLASIYGPTMIPSDSKAHAQFLRNGVNGEDIVLKSEGLPRRTYCYVIDTATAILSILFNGRTGEAYNVSNENSICSIKEFACTVAELSGRKVVMNLPDATEAKGFSRPQNCILDNSKLRTLGWQGRFSLKEGISETLQMLKEKD